MHGGLLVARPCAGDRRGVVALLFGCGSGDSRRVRRRHDGRRRKSHHLLREERQRPPLFSPRHTHTPGALPPPAPPTDGCWPVVQCPAAASRFTHRAGAGGVDGRRGWEERARDRLDYIGRSVDGWDRACEVRERRCVAESHRFVAAMATVLGSAASHRRSRRRRTTSGNVS